MKRYQVERTGGGASGLPRVETSVAPAVSHPNAVTETSVPVTRDTHSASVALSGAGHDLASVTGSPISTTAGSPTAPLPLRFREGMSRYELLRRNSPEEAARMLPHLRQMADELRAHLPTEPREAVEALRLLRSCYRAVLTEHRRHAPSEALIGGDSATTIATFHRQEQEIQNILTNVRTATETLRDWFHTASTPDRGRSPTRQQIEYARLAITLNLDAARVDLSPNTYNPPEEVNEVEAARNHLVSDSRHLSSLLNQSSEN
ncbi:MAG: hypothetical protein JNK65_05975, partial [Deltaproteobacteria bacterium]|nr:hypothetical protein [Deltaproteobacteria bacterium]